MHDQDVIREFLVESHENLSRLDQELVELEKEPKDVALLASIFRTIHTIKGACGFLAFSTLEAISHQAESLLSQLRDGQRDFTQSLASLILETVDASRQVLTSIETSGLEGPNRFEDLTERLRLAVESPTAPWCATDSGPVPAAKTCRIADANIRVPVELLNKLKDLVDELALTRNQILQFGAQRGDAALDAVSQRLSRITSELQEGVMKARMQPIGTVWSKLPRLVRDLAVALGKQIRLDMDGAGTQIDRAIIEAIVDPLVHLVRNSCDHGIEPPEVRVRAGKAPQGRLALRAYSGDGRVNIEISDDGAGIDVAQVKQAAIGKGFLRPEQAQGLSDREALNLIFRPGLSTADCVTHISGRGVGLDVVKSSIERIGGVVDLSSRPGVGTMVTLRVPVTPPEVGQQSGLTLLQGVHYAESQWPLIQCRNNRDDNLRPDDTFDRPQHRRPVPG